MSRRSLGPRLYLRRGRINRRTGERVPDRYFIRDGESEIGTGYGPGRDAEAETALAEYIAGKWQPAPAVSRSDPTQVLVAEVLALYAQEHAADLKLAPATLDLFIRRLGDWWGVMTVADVKRSTCKAYVKHRTAQPDARYKDPEKAPRVSSETARRELETLGGAIGYWHGEHPLTNRPEIWLPEKPESPRDAMSRDEAAALLKAAMGYRKRPDGSWYRLGPTAITNRKHLRRFILIGLYTGTRHTVMRSLLWSESPNNPWVDLDKAVIFRRGRAERDTANKKRPVVKLPRRLLSHLRRWHRLDAEAKAKAAKEAEEKKQPTKRPLTAHTVLHFGGEPIDGKIRTGFEACVADAGLNADITPHWMRHTAATWLMERNVELWLASAFLGMSSATLIQHYGHHRPDYQSDASEALSQAGGR